MRLSCDYFWTGIILCECWKVAIYINRKESECWEPSVCLCVCVLGGRQIQDRENDTPIWRPISFLSYVCFFAFWHGFHPCVSAPMACSVSGGGELVLPPPSLRLRLSWEHMTESINKVTSLPESEPNSPACQKPPNQLPTTLFPLSYNLQSAARQTKYLLIFTAEL